MHVCMKSRNFAVAMHCNLGGRTWWWIMDDDDFNDDMMIVNLVGRRKLWL